MEENNYIIQICDDSILARKQVKDLILSYGFDQIIEANNGESSVESYKEHRPNLVFMDIVMPVLDGVEATKQIIEFDPDAKIVMLSSIGTQAQIKAAIEAGAKDFIQKPAQAHQINYILEHHLGK